MPEEAAGSARPCDCEPDGAESCRDKQVRLRRNPRVTNAVDDEGFPAGICCGFFKQIEADKQVTAEANTFPADEQEQKIVGEDEREHGEHEEIEIA